MQETIRFNVFGRFVEVARRNGQWKAFYIGNEGKKRRAEDIVIPDQILPENLVEYLSDLCHEWASHKYAEVARLNSD